jgi:polyisoprenoid-binding protein YceI
MEVHPMKSATRLFCLTTIVLCGAAIAIPDTLIAAPKLPGPGRKKAPKLPPPSAAASTTGFEVGPDAMSNYQVDPKSSINEVVFTSTAPKETIKGKTTKATGHLDLNPRKLDSVAGRFAVAWSDIDTGNKTRNGHMMDEPWVNAKSHPKIEFIVKSLELSKTQSKPQQGKSEKEAHALKGKLIGTMSMNGKDKEMKIPVTLAYVEAGKDKDGKEVTEGIGIKARFSIALADFDIKGKGVGQAVAKSQKLKVALFLAKSEGTSQDKTSEDEKKDDKKEDGEAKES